MTTIIKYEYFGPVRYYSYSIESQKRGEFLNLKSMNIYIELTNFQALCTHTFYSVYTTESTQLSKSIKWFQHKFPTK